MKIRKNNTPIKIETTIQTTIKKNNTKMSRFVIGLDVSLSSSGIVIFDTIEKCLHLFCFAQRKREEKIGKVNIKVDNKCREINTCLLTILPPIKKETCDAQRYMETVETIINCIVDICTVNKEFLSPTIFIEQYAFGAIGSSSYKLQELGGHLKATLFLCGVYDIHCVGIGTWKKRFTGTGSAKKSDIYKAALNLHHLPDLIQYFPSLSVSVKTGEPPSPVNDMYDAIGLVDHLFVAPTTTTRKRRKLK